MKKAFLSFAILAMILLVSCTKPGPIGPIGPAGTNGKDGTAGTNGINGTAGTTGTAGTNGTNGINGNANVISSNTVVLNNWTSSLDDGKNFMYTSSVLWASITQAIVDKGIVLVYLQTSPAWIALPFTASGMSGTLIKYYYSSTLNYAIGLGKVVLSYNGFVELGSPGVAARNGDVIRIVAIPASVVAANPNTNWQNYQDVMKVLN